MQLLLPAEVEAEDQEEEEGGKCQQEADLGQGEILVEEEVVVGEGDHLGVTPEQEIILREIYHLISVGGMLPEIEEGEEGEVRDHSAADKELLRLEDEVEREEEV